MEDSSQSWLPRPHCAIGTGTQWSLWLNFRDPLEIGHVSLKQSTYLMDRCKKQLNESLTLRNKIRWSGETKIKLLSLNFKHHVGV